ncbi:hypothetical protein TWF694_011023 [Orbilia ellipsospora]|uniref:Uncharacterized protein n=1 Tax=Orbilia ellipsospora TaxID=2528407 RepID=A0AAV9X845_9PEZI
MTLWRAKLKRAEGEPAEDVLVEWRAMDAGSNTKEFHRDVVQLANLLFCLDANDNPHLPRCIGFVKLEEHVEPRPGTASSLPNRNFAMARSYPGSATC